jgi:hypothetical protein
MGMDIYGKNPTGPRGEYFRNSISEWHPLARYCNLIAQEICAPCKHWHHNEGDGLDAAGAVALADALEKEIAAGWAAAYGKFEDDRRDGGKELPEVVLLNVIGRMIVSKEWTEGTSSESSASKPDGVFVGKLREPSDFVENVAEFAAFLRESGGFSIW